MSHKGITDGTVYSAIFYPPNLKNMRRRKITKNYPTQAKAKKSDETSAVDAGKVRLTREERIRKINAELKELGLMEFNKSMKRYEYHIHINDYLKI